MVSLHGLSMQGALAGVAAGVACTTWINIGKQLGDDITPHLLPLVYNRTVCSPSPLPVMGPAEASWTTPM